MLTWSDLAAHSLGRQFPDDLQPGDVAGLLGRSGPVQSQTARSVFLGSAARLPGVTREQITAAYESFAIVRGSSLRGTVHTSTAALHPLLEVATRRGQRALWMRTLRPTQASLEDVWSGIEAFAAERWRTPAELAEHLSSWLAEHDPAAVPRFAGVSGRYFAFGHGGLIRRPLKGDWSGQAAPGYRTAAHVLGDSQARTAALGDPEAAIDRLVLHQIAAAGPLSRQDLAWWSGLGLTVVDASLARLGLAAEPGPDGRLYHDVDGAPSPVEPRGVRLLPEFDALLCAFDPSARQRFVDADDYQVLWKQENGMLSAPVLLDGRLRGHWRLVGTGARRTLTVTLFAGARPLNSDELDAPVAALEAATGVRVERIGRG